MEEQIKNQTEQSVEAPTAADGETAAAQPQDEIVIDAMAAAHHEERQNGSGGEIDHTAAEATPVDPVAEAQATIARLETELAAAQSKNAELLDKLQRTAAEFQNSRRRQEKQLADEIERAGSHIVQQLLPVMDDLELAFANVPAELEESSNAWLEGFRQIRKKLETLLDERGVVVIAKEGPFDPIRHEAISSEPSDTVESGHIIQTLRAGYEFKGRVLRPALVRVAM